MRRLLILLGVALLLASAAGLTWAQTGYELIWWTVDAGGAHLSSDGGYVLLGTAGQPDAGQPLSSASYLLTGGFWSGAPAVPPTGEYAIFLPLALR